ncbi:prolyl oligopeptidase family serine peptidase [Streptomyces sp. NPDC059894]|uniref:prolyl oligopeptidase family serine peptidase n=1 Tax=unclassified Streptomyces TaxID=2593676 RepID=UPI003668E1CF
MEKVTDAPALRRPADEEVCGRRVPDPFRWLEDDGAAECGQWLREQQRLLDRTVPAWRTRPAFRALLDELTGTGGAAVPVVSAPVLRGRRRFFLRRRAGQELPVLVTAREGEDVEAGQVVLDPMRLDPSGRTTLSAWRPSWSGRLLAFQVAVGGAEEPVLRVMDVTEGRMVDGPLAPGRPSAVAWLTDDTGFYYVTGKAGEARRVRLHRIGDDPAHDPVVFETAMRHLSVRLGPEGRWLTISAAPGAQTGNVLHLADLATGPAGRRGLAAPQPVVVHDGTVDGSSALIRTGPRGLLYGITNAGAPRGRVCLIDPADPRSTAWTTLVEPGPDNLLSACTALTDPGTSAVRLLVSTVTNGVPRLSLHDPTGRLLADIPAPGRGPGTVSAPSTPPGDTDRVWFTYTDFTTPPAVHRLTLPHGQRRPETGLAPAPSASSARPRASGHQDPDVRQVTYRSEDGTPVGLYLIGAPDDPDQLATLLSYSPYHNVRPGTPYPTVLLTSPRTDPRVGAAHMRKFAAALQQATTSGKPVLLRTEDGVGHGPRAASRYACLHSDALAFCAHHTGLLPPGDGQATW